MTCFEPSPFDAEAFGLPFYRVKLLDNTLLPSELAYLTLETGFVADAKVPAWDVANANLLLGLGFRKVCMQIQLTHNLQTRPPSPDNVTMAASLNLPDEVLWRHARNFSYDRFSLDPLLPRDGVSRLFHAWLRNSLTQGRKQILYRGDDFCTFSIREDGFAAIDLVSVLVHRKGTGKAVIDAAILAAMEKGARGLHVVTECENYPAWQLYLKCGFMPTAFTTAFHLVQPPASHPQSERDG